MSEDVWGITANMAHEFYQTLLNERGAKLEARTRLDAELTQLEEIIRLYEKQHGLEPSAPVAAKTRARSRAGSAKTGSSVKKVVMDVLNGHPEGLTTAEILAAGGRMGHQLNRATVASLLSVEAKASRLYYDEDTGKYRLSAEAPEGPTSGASLDDEIPF